MSYIPYELVWRIFQYMPLEVVIRLSRVSKTWNTAFSVRVANIYAQNPYPTLLHCCEKGYLSVIKEIITYTHDEILFQYDDFEVLYKEALSGFLSKSMWLEFSLLRKCVTIAAIYEHFNIVKFLVEEREADWHGMGEELAMFFHGTKYQESIKELSCFK